MDFPCEWNCDGGNANVDTAGHAVTLSGALSGLGGLNKIGSGTLTLSNANVYSGGTTISNGTLALGSSATIGSTSTINVQNGAYFDVSAKTSGFNLGSTQTLEGNGTVLGSIVAASGSHIAPGESAGTLTLTGDLTLNEGALLDFELGTTSASDRISMTGSTLFLNNQQFSDFTFSALSGFGVGTYTLIDAGTISGNLVGNLSGNIGAYQASLSILGNDLLLTVVPEPGAWLLLATACLALFVGKRMGGNRD